MRFNFYLLGAVAVAVLAFQNCSEQQYKIGLSPAVLELNQPSVQVSPPETEAAPSIQSLKSCPEFKITSLAEILHIEPPAGYFSNSSARLFKIRDKLVVWTTLDFWKWNGTSQTSEFNQALYLVDPKTLASLKVTSPSFAAVLSSGPGQVDMEQCQVSASGADGIENVYFFAVCPGVAGYFLYKFSILSHSWSDITPNKGDSYFQLIPYVALISGRVLYALQWNFGQYNIIKYSQGLWSTVATSIGSQPSFLLGGEDWVGGAVPTYPPTGGPAQGLTFQDYTFAKSFLLAQDLKIGKSPSWVAWDADSKNLFYVVGDPIFPFTSSTLALLNVSTGEQQVLSSNNEAYRMLAALGSGVLVKATIGMDKVYSSYLSVDKGAHFALIQNSKDSSEMVTGAVQMDEGTIFAVSATQGRTDGISSSFTAKIDLNKITCK